ncbi:MAG: penicillin-insensitive murein endopeptidase [Alphaproteobacteria bacterium]
MKIRKLFYAIGLVALISVPAVAAGMSYYASDDGKPSVCYGNAVHGRLENAKRLPYSGTNYRAYHLGGFLAGRTFMHSSVRDAIRDAYAELAASDPELRFVYAEASWPWGGRLRPHRTHANGTSVDFMTPVRDSAGKVQELTGSVVNMLGYAIRFDNKGRGKGHDLNIDFEAMAKHLIALNKAAKKHHIRISRVIFEPPLLKHLRRTPSGRKLRGINFMNSRAWFRHDQHYHVDFAVPCKKLRRGRRHR